MLVKVGFLISLKSDLNACRELDFIGKNFDSWACEISNGTGMMVGIFALWLPLDSSPFSYRNMACLLGRLEWALRSNACLGPFFGGPHMWEEQG